MPIWVHRWLEIGVIYFAVEKLVYYGSQTATFKKSSPVHKLVVDLDFNIIGCYDATKG